MKIVAAFGAIYLFWGGTFLAIRYAVLEIPPFFLIGVRCAGGALVLFGWLAWRRRLERVGGGEWLGALAAGVFLFAGCHGLLAWAEQRVSSGMAALYLTTVPVWLVVIVAAVERRRPTARIGAGLLLGILGVATLSTTGGEGAGTAVDRGALLLSGLFWAVGSVVGRHARQPASVVQATAMQLAAGAVVVVASSLLMGELDGWTPGGITARGAASLAFLVLCGTALAFAAYTWLLRVTTPALVGTYAYVNPVVALVLAWLVQDGELTGRVLVAAPLVLLAVALSRERRPAPADRTGADREPARSA